MLDSGEVGTSVHHSVASLRALVKSFREQVSRFFLPKAHFFKISKIEGSVVFSHQQLFSQLELVKDSLDNCVFSSNKVDTVEMRAAWRCFPEQSEPLNPNHLSTDVLCGSQRRGPARLSGTLD